MAEEKEFKVEKRSWLSLKYYQYEINTGIYMLEPWEKRFFTLAIKGVDYDYRPINLLKGEQKGEEYKLLNPAGGVPSLHINGKYLTQSVSIIEYLDEIYPDPPLLPKDDPVKRAEVRKLTLLIAADIQPIQNLKVLKYIGDEKKMEFGKWVIDSGFKALEKCLEESSGKYCFGDEVTMADVCLVPQVFNANRFKVDMTQFPVICRIHEELVKLEAFKKSHPTQQPDCPEELR